MVMPAEIFLFFINRDRKAKIKLIIIVRCKPDTTSMWLKPAILKLSFILLSS